jgi:hypothetical protein
MTRQRPARRASLALVTVMAALTAAGCSGSPGSRGRDQAGPSPGGATSSTPSTRLIAPVVTGSGSVSVFPEPGSRTALPATQISFRGISPAKIIAVTVRGSVTGKHTGEVEADSDGQGGSFVPTMPFRAGERVTVTSSLAIRGATGGTFSFRVATPAVETTPVSKGKRGGSGSGSGSSSGGGAAAQSPTAATSHYASAPELSPPVVSVTTDLPQADHQLVSVATKHGGLPAQLLIVNDHGEPVWVHPMAEGTGANDLFVQSYQGKPVLTYWQGFTQSSHGYGLGVGEILDSHYHVVATVHAGNGTLVDLHEFQLTPRGTALITAYESIRWDLRSVGGPQNGIVLNPLVQEIDVKTGLVLFQWSSLDHIPLSASAVPPPSDSTTAWDYVHMNSIDVGAHNTLLLSARNTGALYDVDRTTGNLLWTLGGKASDFHLTPGAAFSFQHDARWHGRGAITLFDDAGGPPRTEADSRALRLNVDLAARQVSVVRSDRHNPGIASDSQGNVDQLRNGDIMVGWGDQSNMTEFDRAGRVVWDARFPNAVTTYRAFRISWTGEPTTRPSVAVTRRSGARVVAVSWNGDTRTASWRLLSGTSGKRLHPVATVTRTGFETDLPLTKARGHSVQVQALSSSGRVLASSAITSS